MHAQRQAVTGGVDLVQHPAEVAAPVAHQVQHRAEDFAIELGETVELDQGRHDEGAMRRGIADLGVQAGVGARGTEHGAALGAHALDVSLDLRARFGIDHRPDVDRELRRVTQPRFGHRALQHRHDLVGRLLLHAQHPQGGAALAGAVEGRGDHVGHDLLDERRGVDQHRVLATGLGDQRHRATAGAGAHREALLEQARDVGRAGEHDALHARVGHQRGADGLNRDPAAAALPHAARRRPTAAAPCARRPAASARPAWRAPGCRRRAPRRSAR